MCVVFFLAESSERREPAGPEAKRARSASPCEPEDFILPPYKPNNPLGETRVANTSAWFDLELCCSNEDDATMHFSPSASAGQEFVVPTTGFFCSLCSIFYQKENMAKERHCSSRRHYESLQVHSTRTCTQVHDTHTALEQFGNTCYSFVSTEILSEA